MKVLHIVPDLGTGGAEKVILSYLEKNKNNPEIEMRALSLSHNQRRLYEIYAEEESLPVDYLGQSIHDRRINGRLQQIGEIRRYIKKYNPDVIHIHLSILWMVCLATIGTKTKALFHTLHSNPEKTSIGKNLYIDRLCYHIFRVYPICLNNEMKCVADRIFKINKTYVLPNGIDISKYQTGERNIVRKELLIDDDCFVVGHVGRFHPVKNHKKIIGVFSEIIKRRDTSVLILVGEGNNKEKIIQMCKEKGIERYVRFLGTRNDINRIMQSFDAFIFPSLYEGLGIVMIEAQAAGLHCVMSDCVPTEVIATKKVAIKSVDEPDKEWADELIAIEKEYDNQVVTLEMYSLDSVIERLIKIYEERIHG